MEEGYWGLFWSTGRPEFYLLQKREDEERHEEQEQRTR